ncbi:DUF378 domain-containing protein [Serpentinicella sp. ANB-PHB4]|uniref:DUF378 domain-containing protein n=1 Tax=Serpentinicella sp. ANB-PHB4 TaxID=3074076 RepID=UPI002865BFA8|nr:DUF378 domain-containing protein [Serpentinicella sp. ANB-PHB4]MDR5658529.1 DUF378 domain-containing protein [Serpentinicella sp. ANB-PHB4]
MLTWIALIFVIVGAINWGLIGLFNVNIVDKIFGVQTVVTRFIYTFVGISGVYLLLLLITR